MRLVSVQEASVHCHRDTTADDADFADKVEEASEMVLEYIGAAADSWTDSSGHPFEDSNGEALNVPKRVKSATKTLVNWLYHERDGSNENQVPEQYGYGYLPIGVIAILYPLRRPTVV